ncbi:hypothetical protein M8C21_018361 [Ambrosia artemisiifolia]|uniref:non-specific serine/threonine protein kinase n=1 Tax=Ambrosia artemisiifolia TaxID=4212 RepID=A0AAD5G2A0_AMBAR|nr:hypothetical protein M8C21_018361 [Ambrosia artemisiifolia]
MMKRVLQIKCFSCFNCCSKDVQGFDADIKPNGVADNKVSDNMKEKCFSSQRANVAHSFTFRELATATQNFKDANLIGEGGFGSVYKGRLESGKVVAVKQLNLNGLQGNQEFIVEVLMLSLLRHSNLVTLIGYCTDGDQRLLVYEYMPLGSLENHLFDLEPDQEPLDWHTRLKIAVGAARGLEYLHCKANPPARPFLKDRKKFVQLVDPKLQGRFSVRSVHHVVAVTAMCLQEQANFRPLISDIVVALEYLASQAETFENHKSLTSVDSQPSPSKQDEYHACDPST